jgi:hypothetical protein
MRLARVLPRGFTGVLVAALSLTAALPAEAQQRDALAPAAASARALEDARWAFTEGVAHYEHQRFAEALVAFERSQAIVASPNTGLMVARCLRGVGRAADAVAAFDRAEEDARERAAQGETKYTATLDAARSEGARLRATLGTILVRVARPAGATITIDGKPISVSSRGEATFLREPGTVSVLVRDASGAEQKQTVTVARGSSVTMDFAGVAAPAAPGATIGPPGPPHSARSWAVPAAVAAGAVAVAGGVVFAGFGSSSQSTYDELSSRCGAGGCGPSDRAEADRGARAQTIANVGLAVGAVALAATLVFVVVAVSSGGTRSSAAVARRPAWFGRVSLGGVVELGWPGEHR